VGNPEQGSPDATGEGSGWLRVLSVANDPGCRRSKTNTKGSEQRILKADKNGPGQPMRRGDAGGPTSERSRARDSNPARDNENADVIVPGCRYNRNTGGGPEYE